MARSSGLVVVPRAEVHLYAAAGVPLTGRGREAVTRVPRWAREVFRVLPKDVVHAYAWRRRLCQMALAAPDPAAEARSLVTAVLLARGAHGGLWTGAAVAAVDQLLPP